MCIRDRSWARVWCRVAWTCSPRRWVPLSVTDSLGWEWLSEWVCPCSDPWWWCRSDESPVILVTVAPFTDRFSLVQPHTPHIGFLHPQSDFLIHEYGPGVADDNLWNSSFIFWKLQVICYSVAENWEFISNCYEFRIRRTEIAEKNWESKKWQVATQRWSQSWENGPDPEKP